MSIYERKVLCLLVRKKKKPIIYEGFLTEQYKHMKNKWIRLSVVSVLLPLIFAGVVSCYIGTFNLLDLFGNGEILLSLFSLTVPMLFDLFDIKQNDDEKISWAFFTCLIIVCIQLLLYCMTRIDNSQQQAIKSIIASLIMLVASWLVCVYSIRAIYMHGVSNNGGGK